MFSFALLVYQQKTNNWPHSRFLSSIDHDIAAPAAIAMGTTIIIASLPSYVVLNKNWA